MNALSDERRVLTYGTFDLFHHGHVRHLRRLAAMGDRLIVGLSTDEYAARKSSPPVMSFEERREVLLACQYVDRVIVEDDPQQARTDIVNYNVSLFAASDQETGSSRRRFDDLHDLTQVIYLPRIEHVTTDDIRNRLELRAKVDVTEKARIA